MNKSFILLFVVILSPLVLLAQNTNPRAASIEYRDFDLVVYNPCNGDDILMEGEMVLIRHSNSNDRHFQSMYMVALRGVSGTSILTGEKYIYVGGIQSIVNWSNTDEKRITRGLVKLNLISQGKEANRAYHSIFLEVYNRDGELVLEIDKVSNECR